MNVEPLKGKGGFVDSWQIRDEKDVHPSHATWVFDEEELQSAICWLKQETSAMLRTKGRTNRKMLEFALKNLIDEAFEDVTKYG